MPHLAKVLVDKLVKQRKTSLRRIAYDLDVSVQAVSGWGKGSVPSFKAGLRLAELVEPDDVSARWRLARRLAGLKD